MGGSTLPPVGAMGEYRELCRSKVHVVKKESESGK